jgi:hypothetical protein
VEVGRLRVQAACGALMSAIGGGQRFEHPANEGVKPPITSTMLRSSEASSPSLTRSSSPVVICSFSEMLHCAQAGAQTDARWIPLTVKTASTGASACHYEL